MKKQLLKFSSVGQKFLLYDNWSIDDVDKCTRQLIVLDLMSVLSVTKEQLKSSTFHMYWGAVLEEVAIGPIYVENHKFTLQEPPNPVKQECSVKIIIFQVI